MRCLARVRVLAAASLITAAAGIAALAAAQPKPAEPEPAKPGPSKPTSHTVRKIEGWTVRVDDRLLAPPGDAIGAPALRFLEYKLGDIKAVLPKERLTQLQGMTIVLDLEHGELRTMQYHPSADWLEEHGYARDLAKCVHIPEAADLPTPRNINEQPWVVLHELAHAYHDQVLGFEEPRIEAAYERFKRSGRGDAALLYDGKRVRHYGLTDAKEFFAEMTEAYFGLNDFFPFNRAELMTAEPEIHALMRSIWEPGAKGAMRSPRLGPSPASVPDRNGAGSGSEVFHDDERGEDRSNRGREVGAARGVLLDRGVLPSSQPRKEFLGEDLDGIAPAPSGRSPPALVPVHFHADPDMPGTWSRTSFRRVMARM